MISNPEFRTNLLVSIITSLIVLIFIEPLLKLSVNGLMWLGTNASNSWTNQIYFSAALGLREKFSFMILGLGISLMSGVFAGLVTRLVLRQKNQTLQKPRRKISIWVVGFSALVTVIISYDLLARNFAELQLIASFNQRITVLAAKASDQQIRELRASWALMEKRADYEAINIQMQQLGKQFNIKLPAPLWE